MRLSSHIERAALRNLTDRLGDRSFGMLLIIMGIFTFIPLISSLAGLLIVVLGIQMTLGMTKARLPKFILDRQLPSDHVKITIGNIVPRIQFIEKYVRPRLQFTEAPIVDSINGMVIAVLGAIIALPIPFTNLPPAIVVIIMGIGLSERDGLVQMVAASLGFVSITLITYFIL